MKGFKGYVTEEEDVYKTLSKLPPQFRELVKDYKFIFEPHNTLKGDDGHVGMITNQPDKVVRIAAPWRYSREFTVLHEIAHLVYEKWIRGTEWQKEWEQIVKSTKFKKKDESAEELWCHNFANFFCQHPHVIHHNEEWRDYLKRFIKATSNG